MRLFQLGNVVWSLIDFLSLKNLKLKTFVFQIFYCWLNLENYLTEGLFSRSFPSHHLFMFHVFTVVHVFVFLLCFMFLCVYYVYAPCFCVFIALLSYNCRCSHFKSVFKLTWSLKCSEKNGYLNAYNSLKTVQTPAAEEDHVTWSKAPEQLQKGPCCEIVFSTKQSANWIIFPSLHSSEFLLFISCSWSKVPKLEVQKLPTGQKPELQPALNALFAMFFILCRWAAVRYQLMLSQVIVASQQASLKKR